MLLSTAVSSSHHLLLTASSDIKCTISSITHASQTIRTEEVLIDGVADNPAG
jgi:hypothetical protein